MTLYSAVQQSIQTAIQGREPFSARDVALMVERDYPDIITKEGPSIIRKYIGDEAKRLMRRFDEEDESQPALLNLPSAISVTDSEGNRILVPTAIATWATLEQALNVRQKNIRYAVHKHRRMKTSMIRLEPIMAGNPTMTVEDALKLLDK
jgi:hypothetical protein